MKFLMALFLAALISICVAWVLFLGHDIEKLWLTTVIGDRISIMFMVIIFSGILVFFLDGLLFKYTRRDKN